MANSNRSVSIRFDWLYSPRGVGNQMPESSELRSISALISSILREGSETGFNSVGLDFFLALFD